MKRKKRRKKAFSGADFNDFGQVIKTLTSIKHLGALKEEIYKLSFWVKFTVYTS